jgi:hypothetical protein
VLPKQSITIAFSLDPRNGYRGVKVSRSSYSCSTAIRVQPAIAMTAVAVASPSPIAHRPAAAYPPAVRQPHQCGICAWGQLTAPLRSGGRCGHFSRWCGCCAASTAWQFARTSTRTSTAPSAATARHAQECTVRAPLDWLDVHIFPRVANAPVNALESGPTDWRRYWQSLEVAYDLVWPGSGHLTWEWTPATQLRGYAHPAAFALLYRAMAALGLDRSVAAVVYAPRLLQALCAAACDVAVYRLAGRWFSEATARRACLCSVASWFNSFCAVRPFSNCVETTLTTSALVLWPFAPPAEPARPARARLWALVLGAAAVTLRPPAAALWACLGLHHLASADDRARFLGEAVVAVLGVLGASAVLDAWCYGQWTFPPLNFVRWNVLSGGAARYGTHPWCVGPEISQPGRPLK